MTNARDAAPRGPETVNPPLPADDDILDRTCILILSYNRAENIPTLDSLERHGYSGDWFIVIDDPGDIDPYTEEHGEDNVYYFDKDDALPFDRGDNFNRRNCNVYARNHCWTIADDLGYDYFLVLDDDYEYFQQRFALATLTYGPDGPLKMLSMDNYLRHAIEFLERADLDTLCMAQGGDFIGGSEASFAQQIATKRKAMNTFLCRTDRPFAFPGTMNEDVNAYVRNQQLGKLFLTHNVFSVDQEGTQQEDGGLTALYLAEGTYVKSFYTLLYSPSSVSLSLLQDRNDPRIHHRVNWRTSVPKIVPESVKADPDDGAAEAEAETEADT